MLYVPKFPNQHLVPDSEASGLLMGSQCLKDEITLLIASFSRSMLDRLNCFPSIAGYKLRYQAGEPSSILPYVLNSSISLHQLPGSVDALVERWKELLLIPVLMDVRKMDIK